MNESKKNSDEARRRGQERGVYEEFARNSFWYVKTKSEAVEKINNYIIEGAKLSEKVAAGLDRLEYGLCFVDVVGSRIIGKCDADLTSIAPRWMSGLVRIIQFKNDSLENELTNMANNGVESETWTQWGHEISGIYSSSRKLTNSEKTVKRVLLPMDEKRFPSFLKKKKKAASFDRLTLPWTQIMAQAISHVRSNLNAVNELPEIDEDDSHWKPVENKVDCAININYMPPKGYYPAHTDDWATYSSLPDIDGSGHHIITYSSTSSLIFVAPSEIIKGVGAICFVVQKSDLWGMRSPNDPMLFSARYDAVHAVLNLTDAPRFSVNFRLGGFDHVFSTTDEVQQNSTREKKQKKSRALSSLSFSNPGPKIAYAWSVQNDTSQHAFRRPSTISDQEEHATHKRIKTKRYHPHIDHDSHNHFKPS